MAAAAGEGIQTSWFGYLSKTYDGDLEQAVAATKAAAQKLGLEVAEESGSIFEKTLDLESRDGTSAVVGVTEVTRTSTRISVKVGYLLGNADAARRIHSEIEGQFGKAKQEAEDRAKRWRTGGMR